MLYIVKQQRKKHTSFYRSLMSQTLKSLALSSAVSNTSSRNQTDIHWIFLTNILWDSIICFGTDATGCGESFSAITFTGLHHLEVNIERSNNRSLTEYSAPVGPTWPMQTYAKPRYANLQQLTEIIATWHILAPQDLYVMARIKPMKRPIIHVNLISSQSLRRNSEEA